MKLFDILFTALNCSVIIYNCKNVITMSEDVINSEQEFVFYQSEDGNLKVQVIVDPQTETIWANQKALAELFGVTLPDISYHLSQVYESQELDGNHDS